MSERPDAVTFQGNPLTLLGETRRVGDAAPDATLLNTDLDEVKLSDYAGKVRIIASVPSLDTGVCDTETRRFNEEAGKLGEVRVLTVSMDLPFAQARWCGAAGAEHVTTLSDHRDAAFGLAYGVLIQELRLLARCVFVVDREETIRYIQLVDELTNEPDYDEVLAAAGKLT
ncbi:MAG: thiol peroxidase [Planctomycetota bacterium]